MRGKYALKYLTNNMFCVEPKYLEMMINIAQDGGEIDIQEDNVNTLEIINNVAVISVDGAMVKRGDFFSNICGMTSYAKIEKQIKTAEKTDGVDTIFFIVDTPGGDVAGVDNVGDKIFKSKLNTVTLYENLGASGGIWAFSASDKVYATQTTQLGSIGVITAINIESENGNSIKLVSSNAPNKLCDVKDKKCLQKIQNDLNQYESIFFQRIERNRGLSKEQIINGFESGGVVMAEKALEIGFLDGITTKDELLQKLVKGDSMDKTQTQLFGLLSKHESKEDKDKLTALLATYGVNAVWDEENPTVQKVEEKAKEIVNNSSKISALLSSTTVLSEEEKISCIEKGLSFDEVKDQILTKEKANREPLDVLAGEVLQQQSEAEALIQYAKNHKIRG